MLRFLEFFAASIRNLHTRRACGRAVAEFLTWCADAGARDLAAVQPLHVATRIEMQTQELGAPSVKVGNHGFHAWSVRLVGDGPGRADQSGRLGRRPVAWGAPGQDAGAGLRLLDKPVVDTTSDFAELGVQFGRKPKLTPHQQREARKRIEADETHRSVARGYNVSQATISRDAA